MSRSLTQTIGMLRYGALSDEADTQLAELLAACEATGKPGAITLTIAFKPGKGGQVEIADEIKLKMPKRDRQTSILFLGEDGGLQRDDPRQRSLPLQAIEGRTKELRDPFAAGTPAAALASAVKTA